MAQQSGYPMQFSVDYPDRPLERFSSLFRILFVIPIIIVLALVGGNSGGGEGFWIAVAGLVFLPPLLLILFRQKYPKWWFDWNIELMRFSNRVTVYIALLRDEYPSTDEEQAVHLDYPYPDAENDLNRWLPLIKWFLAIPHYIVLIVLNIIAIISVIIAWVAILFTGRYPVGLFNFVVGVLRWNNRVTAYAFVLVTDKYPPFSLNA